MSQTLTKIKEFLTPKPKEILSLKQLRAQIDALILKEEEEERQKVAGDGHAVFFPDGTEEDFEAFDRLENKGWKGFYKKILNLNNKENDTTIE